MFEETLGNLPHVKHVGALKIWGVMHGAPGRAQGVLLPESAWCGQLFHRRGLGSCLRDSVAGTRRTSARAVPCPVSPMTCPLQADYKTQAGGVGVHHGALSHGKSRMAARDVRVQVHGWSSRSGKLPWQVLTPAAQQALDADIHRVCLHMFRVRS